MREHTNSTEGGTMRRVRLLLDAGRPIEIKGDGKRYAVRHPEQWDRWQCRCPSPEGGWTEHGNLEIYDAIRWVSEG